MTLFVSSAVGSSVMRISDEDRRHRVPIIYSNYVKSSTLTVLTVSHHVGMDVMQYRYTSPRTGGREELSSTFKMQQNRGFRQLNGIGPIRSDPIQQMNHFIIISNDE